MERMAMKVTQRVFIFIAEVSSLLFNSALLLHYHLHFWNVVLLAG